MDTSNNGGAVREGEIVRAQAHEPEPQRSLTLFGTSDPAAVIVGATRMAKALSPVIEEQKLYKQIGNKKHLFIEAWTLCGSMLGVFPVCVWTRRIEGGWEARVEARLRDGSVIGAAEAICKDNEPNWQKRDDYAIKSMAQTRAASKALRMPLGFIVVLGGFDATPAEEMVAERAEAMVASAPPTAARPQAKKPQPAAAPKAAKPAKAATPPPQQNGGTASVDIRIMSIRSIKHGEKNGSPWELFAISGETDGGTKFSGDAFDPDEAASVANASSLKGKWARVYFKLDGKYTKIVGVEPLDGTSQLDPNDQLNEAAAEELEPPF